MRHGTPTFHGNPLGVCRYRDCMKRGYGRPPYCPEHQRPVPEPIPSSIPPIPEALKTAGNARVARRRG